MFPTREEGQRPASQSGVAVATGGYSYYSRGRSLLSCSIVAMISFKVLKLGE